MVRCHQAVIGKICNTVIWVKWPFKPAANANRVFRQQRCGLTVRLILTLTLTVQTRPPRRDSQSATQTANLSTAFVSPREKHFHYRHCHQQINKPNILQYAKKIQYTKTCQQFLPRRAVNTSSQLFVHMEKLSPQNSLHALCPELVITWRCGLRLHLIAPADSSRLIMCYHKVRTEPEVDFLFSLQFRWCWLPPNCAWVLWPGCSEGTSSGGPKGEIPLSDSHKQTLNGQQHSKRALKDWNATSVNLRLGACLIIAVIGMFLFTKTLLANVLFTCLFIWDVKLNLGEKAFIFFCTEGSKHLVKRLESQLRYVWRDE